MPCYAVLCCTAWPAQSRCDIYLHVITTWYTINPMQFNSPPLFAGSCLIAHCCSRHSLLRQINTPCRWAWSGWQALTASINAPSTSVVSSFASTTTPSPSPQPFCVTSMHPPSFPSSLVHTPLRLPAFTLNHVLSISHPSSRPCPLSSRLGPIGHAYISTCILPCPYLCPRTAGRGLHLPPRLSSVLHCAKLCNKLQACARVASRHGSHSMMLLSPVSNQHPALKFHPILADRLAYVDIVFSTYQPCTTPPRKPILINTTPTQLPTAMTRQSVTMPQCHHFSVIRASIPHCYNLQGCK